MKTGIWNRIQGVKNWHDIFLKQGLHEKYNFLFVSTNFSSFHSINCKKDVELGVRNFSYLSLNVKHLFWQLYSVF